MIYFLILLVELLGYEDEQKSEATIDNLMPSVPPKRQKQFSIGTESDWKLLLTSNYNRIVSNDLASMLNLQKSSVNEAEDLDASNSRQINPNSALFSSIKIVHFTLHLLYEELKLNTIRSKDLPYLAEFLNRLSNDLGLKEYVLYYWKDFPEYCKIGIGSVLPQLDLKNVSHWPVMSEHPYSVMQHLYDMLRDINVPAFPFIHNVNPRTKDIVQVSDKIHLCALLTADSM